MVGKVTPKGETELTAEERLLRHLWRKGTRSKRYIPESTSWRIWYRCRCESIYKREWRRIISWRDTGSAHLYRTEEKDLCG